MTVDDDPGVTVVADFHRAWRRGIHEREAFRAAQSRKIRSLRSGHVVVRTPEGNVHLTNQPLYWAGYVLLGEP